MQDSGLVSIITPLWACEDFIEDTIKSVQAQTYRNWELLIQDDCSKDRSKEIIADYLVSGSKYDSRIKYECNSKNSGAAVSRNRALKRAKGKWIAFLDGDDLWTPDKLEKQLEFMVKNNYHFSYTNYRVIGIDSKELGTEVSGPDRVSAIRMRDYCWPGCLTVMYDRDYVGQIQIYDIKKNNDYAMWLKVSEKADCYLLNECLAYYRRGRIGSISTHGYKTLIKWHYKLFRDAEGQNLLHAYISTMRNMVFGVIKKTFYEKKYTVSE